MTNRKPSHTAWKPGQSGNPKGRPPGVGEIGRLRAATREHVPGILERLVQQAPDGDAQATRLLLERVLPPLRPMEQAQSIHLPEGTLTERGRAVLAAVGAGTIGVQQGAQLLSAIGNLARVKEIGELERRVKALEQTGGSA